MVIRPVWLPGNDRRMLEHALVIAYSMLHRHVAIIAVQLIISFHSCLPDEDEAQPQEYRLVRDRPFHRWCRSKHQRLLRGTAYRGPLDPPRSAIARIPVVTTGTDRWVLSTRWSPAIRRWRV